MLPRVSSGGVIAIFQYKAIASYFVKLIGSIETASWSAALVPISFLIKGFAIKIVGRRAQLAPKPHEDRLPLDRNNAPMPSAHRNCGVKNGDDKRG